MLLTALILISTSLLFAPLSNVMLWRKYTNFTDGLSHASIMAAIIASLFGLNIIIGTILNTFIFMLLVYSLKSKTDNNLIITIVSIFIMSFAFVLKDMNQIDVSLKKILFGDIKHSTYYDLLYISILICITYPVLFFNFNSIILISLNQDLAISKGINVKLIEALLLALISLIVGICFKLIGGLMLFGIVIIPPTIARIFSKSPKEMIMKTIIISIVTSLISIILGKQFNIEISPLLICINFIIFVIAKIIRTVY